METIKIWLRSQYDCAVYGGPEILRMEHQELEKVKHMEEGTLLQLEHAAWIEGKEGKVPIRIFALLMPKDPRVRFWFSALASFKSLMIRLHDERKYIEVRTTLEPQHDSEHGRPDHHCKIFTWLRDEFMTALKVPDHPEFIHAESVSPIPSIPSRHITTLTTTTHKMTDYAPSIKDPDTAVRRIESTEALYNTRDDGRDLFDDRYLLHLHPAERELASLAHVSCAEYLFIKRTFFKEWYVQVYRSEKKVREGQLVRSKYAHEQWLERVYEWSVRRSRRMILGWKVLGLLDQEELVPWVKAGGMLAESVMEMEEEEKGGLGEGDGQGAGKTVGGPRIA